VADLKGALKALRASQPFNLVATETARGMLRVLGARSDLVVRHLHRVGGVRCPLPDGRVLRLWSRGDDWVSNQVFWKGWTGYEPETVRPFYHAAARVPAVVDVGAYVGFFTLLAAHANPTARVFAFEPHPDVYPRLLRNVDLNEVGNVTCVAAAAGDRDGEAELVHVPGGLPTSSSLSAEFMAVHPDVVRTRVPVVTLDGFLGARAVGSVGVLKIDTEGTEPAVLRGCARTLERDRPIIFCEVLEAAATARTLEDLLRPLGYRFSLLTPAGPRPADRIEPHPRWLNHVFTPPSVDPAHL
jgi:FkbM family methyltransferase